MNEYLTKPFEFADLYLYCRRKSSNMPSGTQRSLLILLFTLLSGLSSYGQSSPDQQNFNDSIARSRNRITRTAMITLGSWAVANIATGFIIAGKTTGEAKYAWRMNAYWNFINLGLAGMGYLNAASAATKKYSFADNYQAQHNLEKIYVFNFGLDLAYIAGGLYIHERGRSAGSINSGDELKGYGTSIVAQGAFLLLMDGIMIRLHQKNTIRMNNRLRRFDLAVLPGQFILGYRL